VLGEDAIDDGAMVVGVSAIFTRSTSRHGATGWRRDDLVDREVFEQRLSRLETLIRDLRGLVGRPIDAFLSDRGLQAQAERWTHLAVEYCLDLANHLIADRGWPTADTYRDAFRTLQLERVIDEDLSTNMAGWAGLRKLLVHLYLDVDHALLFETPGRDLDQLEAFAKAAQQELDRE
jgi:uncharacterized protein YutE (UPF0331/DUF86 family)